MQGCVKQVVINAAAANKMDRRAERFRAMILRIANYVDDYDDILQQKYPDWADANFKNQGVNLN